jgi:hypothetical protein
VALTRCLPEQPLGHDAPAAIGDADEENVQAASLLERLDRMSAADSARTYW